MIINLQLEGNAPPSCVLIMLIYFVVQLCFDVGQVEAKYYDSVCVISVSCLSVSCFCQQDSSLSHSLFLSLSHSKFFFNACGTKTHLLNKNAK